MAWFRPMGVEAVAYHEATVVGRADDHPGRALDYYGTRGETPLRWSGAGAARLGLVGEVRPAAYEAAFGPGGFRDPLLGDRLVATTRPGFELVVSAHKTVAVLGVVGPPDDMHSILDVETTATMAWLDSWFQARGGRRGRAQVRTPTSGLTYAVTRHGTSRAGDPSPHDHVLVANIVEMLDTGGGFKGLDSAALRDTTEAATMVGRLASAARAVQLGYAIEPDDGPSGNLRHWRIKGIPAEVCDLFSKRADAISDYLAESGHHGPRARAIAARQTRSVKRRTGVDELLPGWHAELHALGWDVVRLNTALDAARAQCTGLAVSLSDADIDALAVAVLDVNGSLMTRHKVFTRTRLVAELAPRLYGAEPAELDRVTRRILASRAVVPLVGVVGAHEQAYATAQVLATEQAIARTVETLADRHWAKAPADDVDAAIASKEAAMGHALTGGQLAAVRAVCASGRAVEVIVGVAGAGKTTALDAATEALARTGRTVIGAATSGQAAKTLGDEAGVDSRTIASLLWRLDHGQATLDSRTVVIVDEAGMTADADLLRVCVGVQRAGAKLVLVGDPHQLSAVGPGGALDATLQRHPQIVTMLDGNVRQTNPDERNALDQLRDGSVSDAVAWYGRTGRAHTAPSRTETLANMVDEWATDIDAGHDTALLAWRRADVADLNRLARNRFDQLGHLDGPELEAPGGHRYATGDPVVLLAPQPRLGLVTSQRGTVTAVDPDTSSLQIETSDQRRYMLSGEQIDSEHLDHAYATTVHRAQGATYHRAHVLAAGGGRELGYVAMSRARDRTTIHAVADDLVQAVEDIETDWAVDRRQHWVTDTAAPAPAGHKTRPVPIDYEAQRARLEAEQERLRQLPPPDVSSEYVAAQVRVNNLEHDVHDLRFGTGRWQSRFGAAADNRLTAHRNHEQAERNAQDPTLSRRARRRSRDDATEWAQRASNADQHFQTITTPALTRLQGQLAHARHDLQDLSDQHAQHQNWRRDHPDRDTRLDNIEHALDTPSHHDPGEGFRFHRPDTIEIDDDLDIEL